MLMMVCIASKTFLDASCYLYNFEGHKIGEKKLLPNRYNNMNFTFVG